ncbi:hypothetical protein KM043_003434 [Ampulex compressa]|nr:hypothetical protein KM043_003434 [Ampulex compressa]
MMEVQDRDDVPRGSAGKDEDTEGPSHHLEDPRYARILARGSICPQLAKETLQRGFESGWKFDRGEGCAKNSAATNETKLELSERIVCVVARSKALIERRAASLRSFRVGVLVAMA